MAYAYPEYPHTNYADTDAQELIRLYKDLVSKYQGTLDKITALENKLSQYQSSVDSQLSAKAESAVQPLRTQLQNALEEMKRTYTSEFQSFKQQVTELTKQFESYKGTMDGNYKSFKESIEGKYSNFEQQQTNKFNGLYDSLAAKLQGDLSSAITDAETKLQQKFTEQVNDLDERVNQKLDEYIKKSTSEFMWDCVFSIFGFTAEEWYNFPDMTCECWNASKITCAEWFVMGRPFLSYDAYVSRTVSPISGEWKTPTEILFELIDVLHITGMTAAEFDAMHLSAEMYDKLHLTASKYDWRGYENDFRNDKEPTPTALCG